MNGADAPNRLLAALRGAADVLGLQGWALVGGLAVSVRREPRFTRDIDLAVAVEDDAQAEACVSKFVAAGFSVRLSLEQTALGRLATVRLLAPGEGPDGIVLDLLFCSSGIEPEICREAEAVEIVDGLTVPVARAGHLVVMKLLATGVERPQDEIDLRALLEGLAPEDEKLALAAAGRIEGVGANRGRPLAQDLERRLRTRGQGRP